MFNKVHCLQAIVGVCDLATAAIQVQFPVLACATGWWTLKEKFKGKNDEKSRGSSTIALPSTCGIGDCFSV